MPTSKPQKMQDFEAYEEAKLKDWAKHKRPHSDGYESNKPSVTDTRSEEQKAFEAYANQRNSYIVAPFSGLHDPTGNSDGTNSGVENKPDYGTGTGNIADVKDGFYYVSSSYTKKGTLPDEIEKLDSYFGVIEKITMGLSSSNKVKIRETLTISKPFEHAGREFIRFKKDYNSADFTRWKEINLDGTSPTFSVKNVTTNQVASDVPADVKVKLLIPPEGSNNHEFDFTFDIPQGKAGEGGGGGGTPSVPIDPVNKQLGDIIEGKFAVNVFNYREMSRDWRFGVNGKTFTTKGVEQHLFNTSGYIKKLTPYNRIRESEKFWYSIKKVHASHHESGSQDIRVNLHTFNRSDIKTTLEINPLLLHTDVVNEATTFQNVGFGYLRLDIGGYQKEAKGSIELEAWYGNDKNFRPHDDRQDFRFLHYNGIELKANHKGVKDEYKHTRWADYVDIKLNVLELKYAELLQVEDIPDSNNNMLFIKCPSDMWYPDRNSIPSGGDPDTNIGKYVKIMNEHFMTNNLCDITQDDVERLTEDKPFFVKGLTPVEKLLPNGERATYQCFQILIGKENMSKWREHLSQTQIMYLTQRPDKNTNEGNDKVVWVQLPTGGMTYTLNSGQIIETNKYGKLTNFTLKGHKTRGLKFSNSPFGYPDLVIDSDSIASVVLTPYPDDFN